VSVTESCGRRCSRAGGAGRREQVRGKVSHPADEGGVAEQV
jgi:hypothetical protein